MEKKTRNTVQRQIILDTIKRFNHHPTIEDVYTQVKKDYHTISKNTVYRNLRQLAEDGEIQKLMLLGEPETYDKASVKHYHFQCKLCGSLSDIEFEYLDGINEAVGRKHEFQIDEHEIVFRGVCQPCKAAPRA